MATKKKLVMQKTVNRKTVPLPKESKVLVAPLSENAMTMEYMSSVYPIGFGYSKEGNVAVFTHDYSDSKDRIVLEHLITPKQLEKIIETAQDVLDNLGRHAIGVKSR